MQNIKKIMTLSRPLYRQTLGLSLLVLVASVLQQAQPFFFKSIVDHIQNQITHKTGDIKTVGGLMLGLLAINLLATFLNSINMRFGDYINSRLRRFLTEKFYSHVFTLPQRYFDSEISGKILNQLSRGIQAIQDFMGMLTNFVLPALFQSLFTIGILFYYQPLIGGLALAIFPAYIYISHYSTKKWGEKEIIKNRLEDVTRGRISEVIGNIRLVRGFMAQLFEWKLVAKTLIKINRIYDRQSTTYHLINFVRETSLELVLITIALITFYQTFRGQLTLGEMVLILQLVNQIRWPLFGMSFILERIQQAEAGSKEYFAVMALPSEEKLHLFPLPAKKVIGRPSLRFDRVAFQYDADGQQVLHDLSFTIPAGQTVALVGHSGAGKSTIINLILKFYRPSKGEIYLNGRPYSRLSHQFVRSHIALVFQDNELFSTTIRENVCYGLGRVADREIIQALKKANAWDFVRALPGKLDAQIGERGVKLSGGQKQRIQIARAIMRNSPILILDEATSSLDSKSESAIQGALENLMKDRLTIIIAHRFSTIQSADQILVIDDGRLAGFGTPQELAQKPGVYSELLRYQIAGNEKLLAKFGLH
jgi:ATP-binding cassette subfamily B protein